ncbi:MAG TPA: alpha/beta hydrolase-fold protein [Acidimicrobiales bacterium]|jgi:S-formylglutathione hydrolase FrmB
MRTARRISLVLLGVVLLVAPTVAGASHGGPAPGEVTAAEDNPPGCTTATAENQEQCGAQGRDHFADPNHLPPIEACADAGPDTGDTGDTGSRVTRILPDGPRHDDESLAFVPGACVYLPPGYATSGLRYPVVYVLHGGGGDQQDWITVGDLQGVLDRNSEDDPSKAVIAVVPDGRSGQWYDYENGDFLIETYVVDHLVPYVDHNLRTIADRRGRAVVGLSNGGYGAIHFAGKRPDMFIAAGGMSSNLGARTLSGLGPDGAVHYQGSVPYQLAENYDGVDLVLDVANYCTAPDPLCATVILDILFTPDHLAFVDRMEQVGHQGDLEFRQTDGMHQYTSWTPWLEERQLPFLQERMVGPRPLADDLLEAETPLSFRYRSIKPEFEIWGYGVAVERDVREFLDLSEVTAGGFTVRGSGSALVTTAPRYEPGRQYTVTGHGGLDGSATADSDGRLPITVDLGPSHSADQFTDEADIAEATGPDWVTRTVSITPADSPAAVPPPAGDSPSAAASPTALSPSPAAAGPAVAEPGSTPAPAPVVAGPETVADVGASAPPAVAPRLVAIDRSPQLVPTIAFLLLVGSGPAVWWRRRQHREVLL